MNKLMNDPSDIFARPEDVVGNLALSRGEKVEILRQWKQEVTQRLVAEEENMPGDPNNADRLQEVNDALIELDES